MTLLLVLLMALTPASADTTQTCEVPQALVWMEGSAPFQCDGTTPAGARRYETEHGWYVYTRERDGEVVAIWGVDTGHFVWAEGMPRKFYLRQADSQTRELNRVGWSLYNCLLNYALDECGLLRDLLRTQLSKE